MKRSNQNKQRIRRASSRLWNLRKRRKDEYRVSGGNRVSLFHEGTQIFEEMLRLIASAREEILLEMYWFASDTVGWRFQRALAERAQAGIRVCVIYDAVGSIGTDPALFARLHESGCLVHEFNPITPWRKRFKLEALNRRDHRKMLLLDGKIAMIGGVNISDYWVGIKEGGEGWRDDMAKVVGPAVSSMRRLFLGNWEKAYDPLPSIKEYPSDDEAACKIRVLDNHFFRQRLAIRKAYLRAIRGARRSICISNSYFVPDSRLRRSLINAAKRGVNIRILVPARSDVVAVHYASRYMFGPLLASGIKIYEWTDSVLHTKTAVVDEQWSTLGTYNLDYRSWQSNLEVNLEIEDPDISGALHKQMDQDFSGSHRISHRAWRFRSLSERLFGWFFYRFRRLL